MQLALLAAVLLCPGGCCNKEKIPAYISGLHSSKPKDRNDSALALARCGDMAERAVPRLSSLLYDENVGVQSAAAYALRKIDTQSARSALERAEARRKK